MDIKEILYRTLDEIGTIKIRTYLNKDLYSSKMLIDETISKVVMKMKSLHAVNSTRLYNNQIEFNYSLKKQLSVLCESLLHYFLTASTIPSSRKILFNKQELDIVIPEITTLKIAPEKCLVIKFKRDECLSSDLIDDIDRIQPYKKNIWIVSPYQINNNYKNYILYTQKEFEKYFQEKENIDFPKLYIHSTKNEIIDNYNNTGQDFVNAYSFNDIIIDIEKFLKDSNNRSFRFYHAKI